MVAIKNVEGRRFAAIVAVVIAAVVILIVIRLGQRPVRPSEQARATEEAVDRSRNEAGIERWAERIDPSDKTSLPKHVRDRTTGIEMVLIPAGSFSMGSPSTDKGHARNETPQHTVVITRPFYLGRYEVRQSEFVRVMEWNPSNVKGDDLPVEMVSWNQVAGPDGFLDRANSRVGLPAPDDALLRLPTEAEWEYACRAGTVGIYSFNRPVTIDLANYDDTESEAAGSYERRTTRPVDTYDPNPWGLHNMHGNVHELCADVFDAEFYADPLATAPDPQRRLIDDLRPSRVIRGGSWIDGPGALRSASRGRISADGRYSSVGFRVCRTAIP